MAVKSAPTNEIGTGLTSMALPYGQGSAMFVDDFEYVSQLQFPGSIDLFKQMRNDSQIAALYSGCTLPIRNYQWHIKPNGAPDDVVAALAADLNLPIEGVPKTTEGRSKGRFSFSDHLRMALLGTIFGFMYFEQVGTIVDGKWRLRKLGERLPSTIQEINIERDGGLASIKQNVAALNDLIPVDRLVCYVWDKEGGNWVGRSMLRPLYRDWLIKDRLLRVNAINHERSGAGMPVAYAPEGASDSQIETLANLAQTYVAGEHGGAALPYGADLKLRGVEGSQPDTLSSIKYCDEAMARGFLAMFMQLGQTETGSRALGESFVDFMSLGQQAVAKWFRDIFNEHVIEDWVDWNYGEDVAAPRLDFNIESDKNLSATDLIALHNAGLVQISEVDMAFIRGEYNLPDAVDTASTPVPSPLPDQLPAQAKRRTKRTVLAAATSDVSLPDRPLRRQPYEQEIAAKTDFAAMDKQWVSALEKLVSKVGDNNSKVISEIEASIVAAKGDLAALAKIEATGQSADDIAAALSGIMDDGARGAIAEAKLQGRTVKMPDLSAAKAVAAERAVATDTVLARSLSEAGARKALASTGGAGLDESDVAAATGSYLRGLTDSFLRDQLGGLLTAAQNSGRKEVMAVDPPSKIYSSELLDGNTCGPCTDVDGTEYGSIDDAEIDYPTGGYLECEGGPRCRGTLIATYDEAAPSV